MSPQKPIDRTSRDTVSSREAWLLFRIASISEAFSWILLLSGMLVKYVLIPGDGTWVAVGGSIHGVVFLGYFAAVAWLWRILGLNLVQAGISLIASVIPFGTLLFVSWLSRKRQAVETAPLRQIVVRAIVAQPHSLLAIQSQDTGFWCLPGGVVQSAEPLEAALIRTLQEQTGIVPAIGDLRYVFQYAHRSAERVEFFFLVTNSPEYAAAEKARRWPANEDIDRIKFIPLDGSLELKPAFLLTEEPRDSTAAKPVTFIS